jgi:folate-binding protein YgfZ
MPKTLPLRDLHNKLGASFAAVGEWELPARYSDPLQEYRAARQSVALADLSHQGRLVFRGPDRREFLHGLLTNDIKGLPPFQGLSACLLTPKGKIVANLHVYDRGDDIFATLPPESHGPFTQAIGKYLLLSQADMEDVSASTAAFFLTGPKAGQVLEEVFSNPMAVPAGGCRWATWEKRPALLVSYPPSAPADTIVVCPQEVAGALFARFVEAGRSHGLALLGHDANEILRVEAGSPLLGQDMTGDHYPVEVNLEKTISYDKGCYLGQETIARLKTYGRPARRLVGLKFNGPVPLFSPVLAGGKTAGRVTSVVRSPSLDAYLALALISTTHDQAVPLAVQGDQGIQLAQAVSLPVRP